MDGDGLQPYTDPRPVVKQITFAPPATCPVADTGSYPGVSMKTKPWLCTGWAYSTTSDKLLVPALATAPSDFSSMVVSPPALLPGDGLLFISRPRRCVYSSPQSIRIPRFSLNTSSENRR